MAIPSTYASDSVFSHLLRNPTPVYSPAPSYSSSNYLKANPSSICTAVTYSVPTLQPEMLTELPPLIVSHLFTTYSIQPTTVWFLALSSHWHVSLNLIDIFHSLSYLMSQRHVALLTIASFMENTPLMASVKSCACFYSYTSFADSPSSARLFNADIPQGSPHTIFSSDNLV